jgi:hypothetical protein
MGGFARRIDIDDAHAGALGARVNAQYAGHGRKIRSLCDLQSRAPCAL